jgi:hypothetical protein
MIATRLSRFLVDRTPFPPFLAPVVMLDFLDRSWQKSSLVRSASAHNPVKLEPARLLLPGFKTTYRYNRGIE